MISQLAATDKLGIAAPKHLAYRAVRIITKAGVKFVERTALPERVHKSNAAPEPVMVSGATRSLSLSDNSPITGPAMIQP